MDIDRRIKAKEKEAESRAKALEKRIKVRERKADARRKAYENEMRDVEGDAIGSGLVEHHSR